MLRLTDKGTKPPAVGFGRCAASSAPASDLRPRLVPRGDGPAPTEVAYDADLSGQVFVFTGFRDEVLAARIGNAGGTVGGISRKVTTLLVADADAKPAGKVKKAIEYGIAVRTKESFEREFYIAQ